MYSELLAVGVNGQLYQWKWNDPEPYRKPEVRTVQLFRLSRQSRLTFVAVVCCLAVVGYTGTL